MQAGATLAVLAIHCSNFGFNTNILGDMVI